MGFYGGLELGFFFFPYCLGDALVKYFRYHKQHTPITYDDLSKQGEAYQQMFLFIEETTQSKTIFEQFFYFHFHLLERLLNLCLKALVTTIQKNHTLLKCKHGQMSYYFLTNFFFGASLVH
jgi:F0F1-type ATP synthase alpha subunit